MSQTSDDTKLHSWSRTPGKQPISSSYYHNKNISSSSESSGIGRTPNWNSDTENKFGVFDNRSPWTSNTTDFPKKMSWDENASIKNQPNNMTFGFSSQWSSNSNDLSRNPTWAVSHPSTSDYISPTEVNNLDQYWNSSASNQSTIDEGGDNFLSHNNSIWSTASQKLQTENLASSVTSNIVLETISSSISQSILQSDSDNSNFAIRAFNNSTVDESTAFSLCDFSPGQDPGNNSSQDKSSSEHKTWAQAAGTGLHQQNSISDESKHSEVDDVYSSIINRISGWNSQNVDQTTPWNIEDCEVSPGCNDKLNTNPSAQRNRPNIESNVWTNEPPNGVGVWESHYENIGERTSRWNSTTSTPKPKSSWDMVAMDISTTINSQWNDQREDGSWNSTNSRRPKQPWNTVNAAMTGTGKQDNNNNQPIQPPIGTGVRNPMYSIQRNTNSAIGSLPTNNVPNEIINETINRIPYFSNQNPNMIPNTRPNVNTPKMNNVATQPIRPPDELNQIPLYNSELNRPITQQMSQPVVNHMINMKNQDWSMPDNFRANNNINNNSIIPDQNDNFLQHSSIPPPPLQQPTSAINNNAGMMKNHMIQQMQMAMTNRFPNENSIMLEKQLMNEIRQLNMKQRDLLSKISVIRNIAGSQAIIQEQSRILNEVRQQLHTKEQTLKVIRSQISPGVNNTNQLPNGIISNTGSSSSNNMVMVPPPQSQLGPPQQQQQQQSQIINQRNMLGPNSSTQSDVLSSQMNDMKLQKGRLDLWSQGNMPSNTISPYSGIDKQFYNPVNANNTNNNPNSAQLTQQINNFPRSPQNANFMPNHRLQNQQHQRNQGWPPNRMMSNHSSYSTMQNMFNNNNSDGYSNLQMGSSEDCMNNDINKFNLSSHSQQQQQISNSHNPLGDLSSTNVASNTNSSTALSLPQNLSSGTNVSSAFNLRDISVLSANISEFVPGQPWTGVSYSQQEDPNITLGTGPRSLMSITNDHLEKLAGSGSTASVMNECNSNIRQPINPSSTRLPPPSSSSSTCINGAHFNPNINANRHPYHQHHQHHPQHYHTNNNAITANPPNNSNNPIITPVSNVTNLAASAGSLTNNNTYVLIRDLPSHINIEMLRTVINAQRFPGLIQMHPNLNMKYVLLHFNSSDDAMKAFTNLFGKVGMVELMSDHEVSQIIH